MQSALFFRQNGQQRTTPELLGSGVVFRPDPYLTHNVFPGFGSNSGADATAYQPLDFSSQQLLAKHPIHLLGRLPLGGGGDVGVGVQGKTSAEVAQNGRDGFHVYPVLQGQGSEGVPLRYNKDKRKNPVFSRVSAFVVAYSIPFPTLIANEKSVE